ncbi:GntR family transcriptional regulator [Alteribacillus bidgolensis]|uniref:DNA-binding transcriptional regulator, GntR family n=1 Tax=Alteribacillus bidgolensis TaxID=930129 RepID=A0A1G8R1L0_9BACI|nr:GntR family transcriptional regulator [Alteribacillus bidgolensis]SDJ10300.1 DNA-binding transcriptional regulator, GntR family [Alteribacillus bidgolensis]
MKIAISTASITTQVTEEIRNAIVKGEYEPGKKLSESALSKHYGVSRTPVREALKQLEREGLVEISPRVGTRVTKPTEKELNELFTVKASLEGLAAGLLAKNQEVSKIDAIEEAVNQMEKAVETKDHDLFVKSNKYFHEVILEGADNSKLSYLLELLLNQMPYQRYVYLSIEVPNRLEQSFLEHKKVLTALRKGDPKEAEEMMRAHVEASGKQLKEGIAQKLIKG